MPAITRGDKRTQVENPLIYYSDCDINFSRNPITGNLVRVVNEEAVKSALRSLILTNFGERPYQPTVGSKIRSSLFEFGGPDTADTIRTLIEQSVTVNVLRIKLISVNVFDDSSNFNLIVNIVFTTVNISQPINLSFVIKRVR